MSLESDIKDQRIAGKSGLSLAEKSNSNAISDQLSEFLSPIIKTSLIPKPKYYFRCFVE